MQLLLEGNKKQKPLQDISALVCAVFGGDDWVASLVREQVWPKSDLPT